MSFDNDLNFDPDIDRECVWSDEWHELAERFIAEILGGQPAAEVIGRMSVDQIATLQGDHLGYLVPEFDK